MTYESMRISLLVISLLLVGSSVWGAEDSLESDETPLGRVNSVMETCFDYLSSIYGFREFARSVTLCNPKLLSVANQLTKLLDGPNQSDRPYEISLTSVSILYRHGGDSNSRCRTIRFLHEGGVSSTINCSSGVDKEFIPVTQYAHCKLIQSSCRESRDGQPTQVTATYKLSLAAEDRRMVLRFDQLGIQYAGLSYGTRVIRSVGVTHGSRSDANS